MPRAAEPVIGYTIALYNRLNSFLKNEALHTIADLLTIVMVSGLLLMDTSKARERFGLPDSKQGLALTAIVMAALRAQPVGFVLRVITGRKEKRAVGADATLRSLSLVLLALGLVGWTSVVISARLELMSTDCFRLSAVSKFNRENLQRASMSRALEAISCGVAVMEDPRFTNTESTAASCIAALPDVSYYHKTKFPDHEFTPMYCPTFTVLMLTMGADYDTVKYSMAAVLLVVAIGIAWYVKNQYKQKSDVYGAEFELLEFKKKSKKKAKRGKRADKLELTTSVAEPPAADRPVEYDSAYCTSSEDEHGKVSSSFTSDDEQIVSDCCVCLEEGAATCAIIPCRHLCLCTACKNIGLELCPICREDITDIVLVEDGEEDDYF